MPYIDLTYFSYGVGMVMVGWVIGSVVGIAFDLIKRVGGL